VAIEDITADAVRAALKEYDQLGLAEFCARYDFDRTREFVLTIDGRKYGTRVICAAAHGRLTAQTALKPHDLVDDEAVNQHLAALGFDVSESRPPAWSREELVLACSLLFSNNRKALRATEQPVRDLSALLRQLPFHAPEDRGNKFRSPSSVQRKLYDLMTRLPDYDKVETRAGHLDRVVLQAFLDDEQAMRAEAQSIRAAHGPSKAWALFSADGERKYGGNNGYADVMGAQYVYDNKVANHRRLSVGDLVVVRDDVEVQGVSCVTRIDHQDGVTKVQRVCPRCASGRFDERKRQRPRYRCRNADCLAEFDQPADRQVEVTQFIAHYGRSWRPLDGALESEDLRSAFLDAADQNAIRPVDVQRLQAMLTRLAVKLPPPPPADDTSERKVIVGGRRPTTTNARTGQEPFRKALLKEYGSVCAVTGPCPVEVLQAAHLRKFAEHQTHRIDEGVLLRADVHLLFDKGLLAVDPETWRVVLAPAIGVYETYSDLAGLKLVSGPDPQAIRDHFETVTTRWV
jgi:hypothetical protein